FIGSSSESRDIADAIQANLHEFDVTIWYQGQFGPSRYPMEVLVRILEETDFGVFVFSPDDVVRMRSRQYSAVRDNVIFELGLFMGRLGRERTFIVQPTNS